MRVVVDEYNDEGMGIEEFLKRLTVLQRWFLAFVCLILLAGVFLIIGLEPVAEALANFAYLAIVIAVVMRLKNETQA